MELKIDKKIGRNIVITGIVLFATYLLLRETDRIKSLWDFVRGIISPFLIGASVAFVLTVPLRAIEKKLTFIKNEKAQRIAAICLTLFAVIALIALVLLLLVPQLSKTIARLGEQLPSFFRRVNDLLMENVEKYPQLGKWLDIEEGEYGIDWMSLVEKVIAALKTSVSSVVGGAVSLVGGLISGVYDAIFSVIFAFYCLAQKETLARQGRKLLYALISEKRADSVVRVLRMSNTVFSNFITGQCMEAVILALMFVPVMLIFRLPYVPLICVIIAVTALVPIVGSFAGCILGAFFILVVSPYKAFLFIIIFLILQQVEGNLIYPRVVGQSIGLPGMWVLLAVSVGGDLMGIGGMLLMVPLASVLYTLIREFATKRVRQRGISENKLECHPPELQPHFLFRKGAEIRNRRKQRKEKSQNDQP